MEEECINGQENSLIFMKVSSWKGKETEEVLFGGLMEVGMKDSSEMVFKAAMVFFIGKGGTDNTKVHGIMEWLMEKVFSILKMDKSMKELLNRINSMERAYFTKMIQ